MFENTGIGGYVKRHGILECQCHGLAVQMTEQFFSHPVLDI